MSSEAKEHLETLAKLREAWKDAPRPNLDIPGFDYNEVSRLIGDTELLDRLSGVGRREYAEALLSKVVVPALELDDPSQSGLVVFHQVATLEWSLEALGPQKSDGELEISIDTYKDDIEEIRRISQELKSAMPLLEEQAAKIAEELKSLRATAEKEAERHRGLGGVQVGLSGPTISVATIREETVRLVQSVSTLSNGKGIRNVEKYLSRILRWAQNSFSTVLRLEKVKSRFDLSLTINKLGQRAAKALVITKRVILSSLQRRKELTTRAIAGSFSDRNYDIEYHITDHNRDYLNNFLKASNDTSKAGVSATIDTFLNPGVTSWKSGLQGVIFDCFKLKRETKYIEPQYWEKTEKFDSKRVFRIRTAVEEMLARVNDADFVGSVDPADALMELGFVARQ